MKSALLGSATVSIGTPLLKAHAGIVGVEVSPLKITEKTYYSAPGYNKPLFNQASGIVEIETDGGITGIGQGGSKDMIAQCAQMMKGDNPFRIKHIWQNIHPGRFYPPGREKLHALGALETTLWDIKGKALNVPTCLSLLSKY